MLFKTFMFILGVFLTSLSLSFIILYLNMINIGYSFIEFVNFITRRMECYLIFLGIFLIIISLKKEKKNDLCI